MPQTDHYRSFMMFVAGAAAASLVFVALDATKKTRSPAAPAATTNSTPPSSMPAAMPGSAGEPAPLVTEADISAAREAVEKLPGDIDAMTHLANQLFDGKRYDECIAWYRKVLEKKPQDVGVSTDLGTALWYSGKPDQAIAQFEKSLALNPTHPQTLFNMGIVKLHGKSDAKGALEAWEKLIQTNPNYPQAAELKSQIAALKQMM
ncbi:MAG: tetratricopeptide repeat protein [Acidobacteria bacterium]|nr:tetratricopeptide repeat protein [Acidobacteriota bacterium]